MGVVEEKTVYALTGAPPWVDYQDPGAVHDRTDGLALSVQQKDAEAIYVAHKGIFNFQTNATQAIINALNLAKPRQYKRTNTPNQIGANIYKANDDPAESSTHCDIIMARSNHPRRRGTSPFSTRHGPQKTPSKPYLIGLRSILRLR